MVSVKDRLEGMFTFTKRIFSRKFWLLILVWCPLFAVYWITGLVVRLHEWSTDKANALDMYMSRLP